MKKFIFGKMVEIDGVSSVLITIDDNVIESVEPIKSMRHLNIRERRANGKPITGLVEYRDNCLIFPGFIDIHTHCREDVSGRDNYKEDYVTAGRAALSGGVVCVGDMPNNPIVPYTAESYADKLALARSRCPIDVLPYAAINQNSEPFADVPYKAFIGPSTNHSNDLNFDSNSALVKALKRYSGRSVSFHCENPVLIKAMAGLPTHEERRDPAAEFTAIDTACELIGEYGLRGKICHVSTRIGLESIIGYKGNGVDVSCEVTPHHLYFDTSMLTNENRRWVQVNPPIRPESDRKALLQAIRDGLIDFLATDHAPHTAEEKMKGISGIPELDTYGSFVAWLIKEHKVDPITIFKMACLNPGKWVMSFWPERKLGRILPGYEANLTVIDFDRPATDGRQIYSKCGWSPFDLRKLPGVVSDVWLKGERVVHNDYMKCF